MGLEDIFSWFALGLVPPSTADKKEMRWRIAVSGFSGGITAVVVCAMVIFFGRFNFVQLDVAHASDLTIQAQAVQQVSRSVDELKADNRVFRRGQVEAQINMAALKVCKLIQALKTPKASPLLGDALATQQRILSGLKQQYSTLGGAYNDEACEIILLAGN